MKVTIRYSETEQGALLRFQRLCAALADDPSSTITPLQGFAELSPAAPRSGTLKRARGGRNNAPESNP
jgi:hypothetical protein